MTLESVISGSDEVALAFQMLEQKIAGLPEPYRYGMELELQNLRKCLEERSHNARRSRENESRERESETAAKLQAIFQSAPFAILLNRLDDGVVVDANLAFLGMFGFAREEVIGRTSLELGVVADMERREQAVRLMRERGTLRNFEMAYRTRTGEPLMVSTNIDVITIQGVRYLLSTTENITERKQAEEQLAFHASLLDNIHDAVVAVDRDKRITAWNKAAEELFGFPAREVLGKPATSILLTELTEEQRAYALRQQEEHRPFTLEVVIYTKFGRRLVVESFHLPRFDSLGALAGYVGVSRDITERKRAEEALRQSEEQFARAFRSSPAGLTITHLGDGRIIDANDRFLEMSEFTRDEVIGRTTVELGFHPSAEARAEVLRALEDSGRLRNYEIDFPTRSGTVLKTLYSLETVVIGGETCLLSTFLDITDQRRLEAERVQAMAEMEVQRRLMEQRELERQSIARDIHDGPIQTLSSTSFHLKLIKETFTDPKLQVELSQVGLSIRRSVQELREVMNDLRPPALIHFGLSRAIQIYAADFQNQHPEIEIVVDVMDDGGLLTDQTRLALFRVYQECLSNIIQHAGATRVEIRYQHQKDAFLLEMRDNGNGFIVSNDYALLMRKGHYGLAGMKERAEAIGGSFEISSLPGQGTMIRIQGPLVEDNPSI